MNSLEFSPGKPLEQLKCCLSTQLWSAERMLLLHPLLTCVAGDVANLRWRKHLYSALVTQKIQSEIISLIITLNIYFGLSPGLASLFFYFPLSWRGRKQRLLLGKKSEASDLSERTKVCSLLSLLLSPNACVSQWRRLFAAPNAVHYLKLEWKGDIYVDFCQ